MLAEPGLRIHGHDVDGISAHVRRLFGRRDELARDLFAAVGLHRAVEQPALVLGAAPSARDLEDDTGSRRLRRRIPHRLQERRLEVRDGRSEEHTSELQSLMRSSYAVFCLKKKKT